MYFTDGRQFIAKVSFRDGGGEGCVLIFFSKNMKIAANNHQQENVGSHPKEIPHIQGQRRSPNKMVGGAPSRLKSNLRPARDAWGAQTQPCVHQDQRKGAVTPQETEPGLCLSVSCRAMVGSDLPGGRGSGGSSIVLLEEVASSASIELPSRQPTNWRTNMPKKFSPCCKSSRAHNTFPDPGIWEKD